MIPPRAFTVTSKNGRMAVLQTDAYISQPFDPANTPTDKIPQSHKYSAIWDTGATRTVVTQQVVRDCQLHPISYAQVFTAGSDKPLLRPVYPVNVILPHGVQIIGIQVTEGSMGDANVLIGMDIISLGDFAITSRNGNTVFSFQIPSIEHIDFVHPQPFVRHQPIIGRNDVCPCGSGLKYKKCCGK